MKTRRQSYSSYPFPGPIYRAYLTSGFNPNVPNKAQNTNFRPQNYALTMCLHYNSPTQPNYQTNTDPL